MRGGGRGVIAHARSDRLSEEYESRSERLVGNFPQAFSHLALVNTASNLAHYKKPAEQRSQRPVDEMPAMPPDLAKVY